MGCGASTAAMVREKTLQTVDLASNERQLRAALPQGHLLNAVHEMVRILDFCGFFPQTIDEPLPRALPCLMVPVWCIGDCVFGWAMSLLREGGLCARIVRILMVC